MHSVEFHLKIVSHLNGINSIGKLPCGLNKRNCFIVSALKINQAALTNLNINPNKFINPKSKQHVFSISYTLELLVSQKKENHIFKAGKSKTKINAYIHSNLSSYFLFGA